MLILFDAARRVNPARPFAAGLLPPDPAPGSVPGADAVADDTPGGDVACDPADWPEWTDAFTWELGGPAPDDVPSPEDGAWWAAESDRIDSARVDRHADDRAAESAATDALSAGLTPPDPAPARPRRSVNPVTDADVARVGAVG